MQPCSQILTIYRVGVCTKTSSSPHNPLCARSSVWWSDSVREQEKLIRQELTLIQHQHNLHENQANLNHEIMKTFKDMLYF